MSAEQPLPRWPHDRWISPTTLNNYRNCPYRVRLQYIERVQPPFVYNVFLSKGRIAHQALQRIAQAVSRGHRPIDDEAVMDMARIRLPKQSFPTEEARLAEARDIVRWVRYGRSYIERLADVSWHLIERNLVRPWRILPKTDPYTIMARPDVVISRPDPAGHRFFEIIDYKTGKRRPESMPPVMMRFVARDLLREAVGDASAADVRFTYLWLDSGTRDVKDLTVEFCNDEWDEIVTVLRQLASEATWSPNPSVLCHYCPYFGTTCTEKIPIDPWADPRHG